MSAVATVSSDAFASGFYTVSEAARLLQIENSRRIYGWLAGYRGSLAEAVIVRDYAPIGGSQELSFWDLMEVRFINHFRKQGVPLQTLRKTATKARVEFGKKHPFALSNVTFLTDRKRVFQQVVEETGDKKTLDILGDQYEMYDIIEKILAEGVSFDPATGLADAWQPLPNECPNVIVSPRYAYGHPVVSKIPTSALFRLWKAEGGNLQRVARAFGVSPEAVSEAVSFEGRLPH